MHDENCFITLTYRNECLPGDLSIHKEELQKFFKRLRKNTGKKIRYFACGEYGEKTSRPHYHAIIFGYDFPDKYLHTMTKRGDALYRSPILEEAWKLGHSTIGDVTFESAAYVARYVMKKRKGDKEDIKKHYEMLDPETGEIHSVEPEFCLMSRRPGLGKTWLEKYRTDTTKDFITIRGVKQNLPKYYDSLLEQMGEDLTDRKSKRMQLIRPEETNMKRLREKEKVKIAQTQTLTRDLEETE